MARTPPFREPLERVLFWIEVVTRPVADSGPANDESVGVEARDLYNLMHALEAYDVSGRAGINHAGARMLGRDTRTLVETVRAAVRGDAVAESALDSIVAELEAEQEKVERLLADREPKEDEQ